MSYKYRNVNFEIEVLGLESWRWTIRPRRNSDVTLVGQARGTREQAIAMCQAEIDAMLARQDGAPRP